MPDNKGGRPTHLTPEAQDAICEALRDGVPMRTAAQLAGIPERTVFEWLRRGEGFDLKPQERIYVEFLQATKLARAEGVKERIRRITQAAEKNWQADAWVLERTHPEEFSQRHIIEVNVRKQLEEVFELLRERLPAEIFAQVVDALTDTVDTSEILALPVTEVLDVPYTELPPG